MHPNIHPSIYLSFHQGQGQGFCQTILFRSYFNTVRLILPFWFYPTTNHVKLLYTDNNFSNRDIYVQINLVFGTANYIMHNAKFNDVYLSLFLSFISFIFDHSAYIWKRSSKVIFSNYNDFFYNRFYKIFLIFC